MTDKYEISEVEEPWEQQSEERLSRSSHRNTAPQKRNANPSTTLQCQSNPPQSNLCFYIVHMCCISGAFPWFHRQRMVLSFEPPEHGTRWENWFLILRFNSRTEQFQSVSFAQHKIHIPSGGVTSHIFSLTERGAWIHRCNCQQEMGIWIFYRAFAWLHPPKSSPCQYMTDTADPVLTE